MRSTLRQIDTTKRSDGQVAYIESMLFSLDPFFRIRPTMPARVIQAFFLVAQREGLSVGEYAQRGGLSPTTMSRNLLDLGEFDRNREEGAGLVEHEENAENRREKLYRLTPKGRALLLQLAGRRVPLSDTVRRAP